MDHDAQSFARDRIEASPSLRLVVSFGNLMMTICSLVYLGRNVVIDVIVAGTRRVR
jgi:hypothetical protein